MRYSWKDVPALLRTPTGRSKFISGIWRKSWPLLSRLATLYRRSLIRNTCVITVVGSFGKTTTARAIAAALGARLRLRFGPNSTAARAVLHIRPHDRHSVIDCGDYSPRSDGALRTSYATRHDGRHIDRE